ncbi:MAG: ACT domain-containing protein [Nitrospirota bacterium]
MAALLQLSVFAENRPGRLEKMTKVFADEGINILAIYISSIGDFGAVKLIVDKTDEAARSLKEKGFTVSLNEVLGIELEDRPGMLYEVVRVLGKHAINVENIHVLVIESRHTAYLIVEVEDVAAAKELLKNEPIRFY